MALVIGNKNGFYHSSQRQFLAAIALEVRDFGIIFLMREPGF
jgi:hypothetical protein